jgi:hypothetical protein
MSEQQDQGQVTATESVGGADQQAAQTPQPELTVQDLQNLRSIIDVSAQRGAFRAAEMSAVGSAYNKLDAFLSAVAPAKPAEEQSAAETPAAE